VSTIFEDTKTTKQTTNSINYATSELDDLDRGIIEFLQQNARMPFTQIAEKLGVTERTVRVRVAQLQEEGILSLVGIINPVKLGINLQTVVQVAVESRALDHVIEELQKLEEVRFVSHTSGEYQLLLEVFSRNYNEFSQFSIHKLNKIKGILKTNVIIQLKILKSNFKFVR